MDDLFPIDSSLLPHGFIYSENFISESEELQLTELVSSLELHTFLFRGYEAKRKVASFGYDYHFDSRSISEGEKIPNGFNFLIDRVSKFTGIPSHEFAELLVTEYPPGSVINWHRDAPPFEIIVGISLLSDCKFKLRPNDKSMQGRGAVKTLNLKRRSFYMMKDEAREEWEHSIDKLKSTRYSVTLRTLKK